MQTYQIRLRQLREDHDKTQTEIAEYLGINQTVYSRYETGKRQPSIDIIIQLADLFGVTVDYLLGRQEVEDSTLSEYEIQLLIASRKADERAKEDALNMLMAHAIDTSK